MEHNQIHITDREKASNAYLMSLIAVVMGLPMPIINLIATGIFYLVSRKGSRYVRWHTTQALVSQLPLFILNNLLFWWTIRILLFCHQLSSQYIAYFILVNLYNIADFYATTVSATQSRKGVTYRWFLYGVITDLLVKDSGQDVTQTPTLQRKACMQSAVSLFIFLSSLTLMNTADWMKICGFKPNSVEEWTVEALWKLNSMEVEEVTDHCITIPIRTISDRLCLANGIDTSTVSIHVCHTDAVNAYSMPGNRILINTGLIQASHNEQELAGVMAHELAHIHKGHIRHNMQLQLAMMVANRLLGGDGKGTTSNATSLAHQLAQNYLSRDKESEADTVAIRYMQQAGIDPTGLSDFFDRMESHKYLEFLNDHPDSQKRAGLIKKLIKENGTEMTYTRILDANTWECLQESVKSYCSRKD